MRRNRLMMKVLATAGLGVMLLIPLSMISGVVSERRARRDGVIAEIAESSVKRQKIVGPILVVPWAREWTESVTDNDGNPKLVTRQEFGVVRVPADDVKVETSLQADVRRRGIYTAAVYTTRNVLRGTFKLSPKLGLGVRPTPYGWGIPSVVLGIGDPRGLKQQFNIEWDGTASPFRAGTGQIGLPAGVHADVKVDAETGGAHRFEIAFALNGMEGLDFVPVGSSSHVTVRSPWPHPSFVGKYLPETRSVGPRGFQATWINSNLSTNSEALVARCEANDCAALESNVFGVNLIDPVDVYLKTERSTKYAFLFIAITFVLFFLYEVLQRLAIHPIQYSLVGVALALFFLLLIALAEHIAFVYAYLIAGAACIALIGVYVRHVLASTQRALGFSGLLAALYGMLFVLLNSEDHALLFGALLLFAFLAGTMYVTRRVDWYRIGESVSTGGDEPQGKVA